MTAETQTDGIDSRRRAFIARSTAAIAAMGLLVPRGSEANGGVPGAPPTSRQPHEAADQKVSIVCIIRYEIDPSQRDAFREYAERWGRIIPRCGASLIGYFLPWQGTNYVGWGLIGGFESLSAYERYEERLHRDPQARRNFRFAQERRLIVREERNFVEVAGGTFELPAMG